VLLLVLLLAATGAWWFFTRMEHEPPVLVFAQEIRGIGKVAQSLVFTAEDRKLGLREVVVTISQGSGTNELLAERFEGGLFGGATKRKEFSVPFSAQAIGLRDGPALLAIAARDWAIRGGGGNLVLREFPIMVDTTSPRIELLALQNHVNQGGSAVAVFRTNEPVTQAGVTVGERRFPAYPRVLGEGTSWVAYFAMPYDAVPGTPIMIDVADMAGNPAKVPYPYLFHAKPLRSDRINLSDTFLRTKMAEFSASDPSLGSDPVKVFLTVNNEWRRKNHETFRQMTASSRPERLWRGAFLQMQNTKKMAGWADRRTYVYGGKEIDAQTHLGLDLASTAGAPVPAANDGVVAFIGDLGIYGQTVLIDHGQGLFTGYSHLSSIGVTQGQTVKRGETIGASGQTGMAGGDHLHFAVLIDGVFVSPYEWLDEHWIADNVEAKIGG
jgi:murein DD-endopeptidase MepM/ murein hydrolase activator NlpD